MFFFFVLSVQICTGDQIMQIQEFFRIWQGSTKVVGKAGKVSFDNFLSSKAANRSPEFHQGRRNELEDCGLS